ncbi:KN57_gp047 [Dikerogammarus haemobaphes nudivirus]|nr:KN57_gp047 [Dikerogammarus haemobaphes nudivirus]
MSSHYIYKTRYYGKSAFRIANHQILLPTNENSIPQPIIKFQIYAVPKDYPLRVAFRKADILTKNTLNKVCNFYIISKTALENAELTLVEGYIQLNFPNILEYNQPTILEPINCLNSLTDGLKMYGSLYLRLNDITTSEYRYKNIWSDINSLHEEDDIVLYTSFLQRHYTFDIYHAKMVPRTTPPGVADNPTLMLKIYQGYPVQTQNKVMVLNQNWSIIQKGEGKLACLFDGDIYIWMISLDYIFTSGDKNIKSLGTTLLNYNTLSGIEIDKVIQKFYDLQFNDVSFTEKCIYAEDKKHKLFAFAGVITPIECGPYRSIIKQYL